MGAMTQSFEVSPATLVLSIFLLISCTSPSQGAVNVFELVQLQQELSAHDTLNLDQSCSWEDEARRAALERQAADLIKMGSGSTDIRIQQTIDALVRDIRAMDLSRKRFCQSGKLLVCDRGSRRCVCGAGPTVTGVSVTREGSRCYLRTGSNCFPPIAPGQPVFACLPAARCVTKGSTQRDCSMQNVNEDFVNAHRALIQQNPQEALTRLPEAIKSGMCVCSGVMATLRLGSSSFFVLVLPLIHLILFVRSFWASRIN